MIIMVVAMVMAIIMAMVSFWMDVPRFFVDIVQ